MKNHMAAGWFYSPSQIKRYFATRITSLKPPKTELKNPYVVLRELNSHQWLMFLCGFLAWTWDAFDFFTVSVTVTELAKDFGVSNSDVTWGMTVTLMLRSVGALGFGLAADRYGRRWPMMINLALFVVLELGSGFCTTLQQFIGVRAIYGIAMGGLFGPAAATALEDLPYNARGLLSGLFEGGYAVGYLLAAVFYRALVPTTPHGWRSLFWFGAAPPVLIIALRWYLPETNHFKAMKAEREARIKAESESELESEAPGGLAVVKSSDLRAFLYEAWKGLRENWVIFIYLVVVMTGFNSCAHGSQDFYPTFLKSQVGMDPSKATIVTVVGQLGSFVGGTSMGYVSTFLGRRLTMLICCVLGGAVVPAYVLPRSDGLIASSFVNQFLTGGVWGPIPIHLTELSPQALRGLLVGLTYQLGNLASSASATIQAVIGERYPLPDGPDGSKRFDYGTVMGIFMGAVWVFLIIFLLLGPEMSQEERKEEEQSTRELFELQRDGKTMAEIGTDRALLARKIASGEEMGDKPGPEHVDIETGDARTEGEQEKV